MTNVYQRNETPVLTLAELKVGLRLQKLRGARVHKDGTLEVSDPNIGASRMEPLSLDAQLLRTHSKGLFLPRISVEHIPAQQYGLPNPWRSEFITPDKELTISFLRTGCPVPATFPLEARSKKDFSETRVQVDRASGARNVQKLEAHYALYRRGAFSAYVTSTRRKPLLSLDLQTEIGSRVEEVICAAQREIALRSRIKYLNINVSTKIHGNPEGWNLPPATQASIRILNQEVRANIIPGTIYTEALNALTSQVDELLSIEQRQESTPAQRYGIAARVGVLALLAGHPLQVNCRSGKDRTALFDTECKFVMYQLWRMRSGLPISAPGAKILPAEERAWRMLLLRSGNLEIQKVNAGFSGNKVQSPLLLERIGERNWEAYIDESQNAND